MIEERRFGGWYAAVLGACAMVLTGCNAGPGAPAEPRAAQSDAFYDVDDIEQDPYYRSGLRLVWRSYPQVAPGAGVLFFRPLGDVHAFQDTSNTFSLIEDATGRIRWNASLGRPLEKFVGAARYRGSVLATSESEIRFLDLDNGALLDRQRLSVLSNTRPVITGSIAVMGSSTGEVFGHELSVGVRNWGVDLEGPIEAPVVDLGRTDVGVVSAGGEVIMLDARSGTSNGRRARLFGGVESRPVTDGRTMYVASLDQSVWAYDIRTGRRSWRHRTQSELTAQPIVASDVFIVDAEREGLMGLDAASGERLWTQQDAGGDAVMAYAEQVFLWDGERLSVVALRDGSVRSSEVLPGIVDVVAGEDGIVFVVDRNGVVSKYEPLS